MPGISAKAAFGKLDEGSKKIEPFLITGQPVGSNRYALDAIALMAYEYSSNQTAGAGSTTQAIELTAHGAKVGDLVVFNSGTQDEFEVHISAILDANNFELAAICSASLVGATFDLLRPKTPRVDASGSTLATVSPAPIQFTYNGVSTDVEEDTVTPANNRPLPVKITGVTGDINITAGDLNVQLSHTGASFDSTRIGDGSNLLAINATNEALVKDADVETELIAANVTLSNIEVDTTAILADTGALTGALASVATDFLRVNVAALPSGLATEAKQDTIITAIGNVNTELDSQTTLLTSIAVEDFATEATLAALSTKFNSLGQKSMALSAPVVIASDQSAIPASQSGTWNINNIAGTISLPTGAATEVTLLAMSAKLPATLGVQTAANSFSITPASDAVFATVAGVLTPTYQEILNLTTVAQTFTAPAGAKWAKVMTDDTNVANIRVKIGGTATISSGMQFQPGRSEDYIAVGNISVIAETGTNQKISVQFGA
jgi:hypothetical protein